MEQKIIVYDDYEHVIFFIYFFALLSSQAWNLRLDDAKHTPCASVISDILYCQTINSDIRENMHSNKST